MNSMANLKSIRIGEVLINQGYITEEQLQQALAIQAQDKSKRLGDILVEMGFVSEQQKLTALAQRLNLPMINLDAFDVNVDAVARIPRALADKYKVIAISLQGGQLLVTVNDPLNFFAIEEVRQIAKMPITLCLSEMEQIIKAIGYYYSEVSTRQAVTAANQTAAAMPVLQDIIADDSADDAPVVKLLNSLLVKGYSTNASDIHIEPFADKVSVRIRVDGAIVDYTELSLNVHQSLIARIKILADLDIAEKRIPQDGHFRLMANGIDLNIRVSLVPTVYGEKAVLRFLATNTKVDNDSTFGMTEENYQKMLKALNSPHGIIYMTGPTGSGKTTTLYMMLDYLAQKQVNISTIEDPVERNILRCNQIQVNNQAGLTFDSGLRALLRQDPDIIMVGETRDAETAAISVRAAITGHLVMSTLHTNDAVSSIVRLKDMGVPPYLIASSLVSIVAQRLVRKICPDCKYAYEPTERDRALIGEDIPMLHKGSGCAQCNYTGYRGRISIHEILLIDKNIRNMITAEASNDQLTEYAINTQKMQTLRQSATELLLQGITSIEELQKTVYYEGL